MTLTGKKLQVHHYPQVPCTPFAVDVKDEYEAAKMIDTLADQHVWLFKNKIIPDYCNSFNVVMLDGSEWVDYWNEAEQMGWDDLEAVYENELIF
jgi:hypothetical protein